jgi:hypothetical protein
MGANRLSLALELQLPGFPPREPVAHHPVGALAHQDRPGVGRGLQPRRRVERVAHRGVLHLAPGAQRAQDGESGLDAHAHRHRIDPEFPAHLLAVVADAVEDEQPGAHGALGVVLVRRRRPEQGDHAVARQLDHGAVELLHRADHPGHGLADDHREVLGVQALAEGGRADDVGEQRADDLPLLALGPGGDRRAARRAEPVVRLESPPAPRATRHRPSVEMRGARRDLSGTVPLPCAR